MTIDELLFDSLTMEDKKRILIVYKALLLYKNKALQRRITKAELVLIDQMIDYWNEQFSALLVKENIIGGVYDS